MLLYGRRNARAARKVHRRGTGGGGFPHGGAGRMTAPSQAPILYGLDETAARLHKSRRWLQDFLRENPCGRMAGRPCRYRMIQMSIGAPDCSEGPGESSRDDAMSIRPGTDRRLRSRGSDRPQPALGWSSKESKTRAPSSATCFSARGGRNTVTSWAQPRVARAGRPRLDQPPHHGQRSPTPGSVPPR